MFGETMVLGELLTVWTVRASLLLFAASILIRLKRPNRQTIAKGLWTFGLLWLLVHIACAFHFHHEWSHRAALKHTAQQTAEQVGWPFAGGLYFNYVFVSLWGFDVLWWWRRPTTYQLRSFTWNLGIYGFLLFIVFQAAVVFESGSTRWTALILFALIGIQFIRRKRGNTPAEIRRPDLAPEKTNRKIEDRKI